MIAIYAYATEKECTEYFNAYQEAGFSVTPIVKWSRDRLNPVPGDIYVPHNAEIVDNSNGSEIVYAFTVSLVEIAKYLQWLKGQLS